MVAHGADKKAGNESMGRVLLLLVVALLIVSMISTYLILMLSSTMPGSYVPAKNPAEGSGQVKLAILPREAGQLDINKGVVTLTILPG
jgi:hypothetical protein